MTHDEQLHYVRGIIDNNPLIKVLPITHKSDHGIPLDVWMEAFKERDINAKYLNYQHVIFDPKLGRYSENRTGIWLFEKE